MIVDLQRFIAAERPCWTELESFLSKIEADPNIKLTLDRLQRFHELYERASADLAKLATFSAEPEVRQYLETLVVRAYGEIHETREKRRRVYPVAWFFKTLPETFRRHIRAFYFSLAITLVGTAFGGVATVIDPESRHVTMPFGHDRMTPSERVREEEAGRSRQLEGQKSRFSASLMTHNIQVSIFTLSLGISWGVGTLLLLFYNGIMIGAIGVDYVGDGQTQFLLGWLLPHGSIEIPAILIAGQAGFVLAKALIGKGDRMPLSSRLRRVSPDIVTLTFGVALMLVWAGFVEAFLSQYHEPIFPYGAKIVFGAVELFLLFLYLQRSGRT